MRFAILFSFYLVLMQAVACNDALPASSSVGNVSSHQEGKSTARDDSTISTRFALPAGYHRIPVHPSSFGAFLRALPLLPAGSPVLLYNGDLKKTAVHAAVINIDVGTRDLQQCADAVMRLRAEYFYGLRQFDSIAFLLTNGFRMDYRHWRMGWRLGLKGNQTKWIQSGQADTSYASFRAYMDAVFTYAGTLSLSRQLHARSITQMQIGDVFIRGGSPGHAVMVVDMAVNAKGEKLFMLAQSYMPAQQIHVLKNFNDPSISPWYKLKEGGILSTPEWAFGADELKRW